MSFLKEFTMILSCSNISKSFGEKHILKQVSFHLEDHEKAAIVGINGAGKSTLLKIIIGAGNLGQAIANYTNFERRGFVIRGMFDINPKLIGLVIRGIEIRSVDDLETFIRENEIQIAALTIPKTKAPEIADRLVNAGIRAIWNFAHTDLVVPEDVVVENVHLSESLMRLSYRVSSMYDLQEEKKNALK